LRLARAARASVATCGARAAASDANDWTPQRRLSFFLWLS